MSRLSFGVRAVAVALLLTMLGPGVASADSSSRGAGWLDPRFGHNGTVVMSGRYSHSLYDMEVGPYGRIYTLTGTSKWCSDQAIAVTVRSSSGAIVSAFNGGKPLRVQKPVDCGGGVYAFDTLRRLSNGQMRIDIGTAADGWGGATASLSRTAIVTSSGAIASSVASGSPQHLSEGTTLTDGRTRGCQVIDDGAAGGTSPWTRLNGTTRDGRRDTTVPSIAEPDADNPCFYDTNRVVVASDAQNRLYSVENPTSTTLGFRRWTADGDAESSYEVTFSVAGRSFSQLNSDPIIDDQTTILSKATQAGSFFVATTTTNGGSSYGRKVAIAKAYSTGGRANSFGTNGVAELTVPSSFGTVVQSWPTAFEFGANGTLLVAVHASVAKTGGGTRGIALLARIDAATGKPDTTFGRGGWVQVPVDITSIQQGAHGSVLTAGVKRGSTSKDEDVVIIQRRLGERTTVG